MGDKKLYASYEKTVEATVVKTTHKVRIMLNETAAQVRDILKNVPGSATVSFIIGDTEGEFDNAGEISFTEEKIAP